MRQPGFYKRMDYEDPEDFRSSAQHGDVWSGRQNIQTRGSEVAPA
jgi:hypothetical protein